MITDFNSDDVHDDVELILNCSGPEIIELVASDPKHYLEIINSYNKTRDGRDIYLPDLCNIVTVRNANEFRIKFKLSDNSNWHEVGFCGGEFTEEEVYHAFAKKAEYALSRPLDHHRSMLLDTLLPSEVGPAVAAGPSEPAPVEPSQPSLFSDPVMTGASSGAAPAPMMSQGDQTRLSKMDRFMGRSAPIPTQAGEKRTAVPPPAPTPVQPAACNIRYEVRDADLDVSYEEEDDEDEQPVSSLSALDVLKTLCPADRKNAYDRIVSIIRSDDMFYTSLIDLLPRLSPGQRCLIIDFLQN